MALSDKWNSIINEDKFSFNGQHLHIHLNLQIPIFYLE